MDIITQLNRLRLFGMGQAWQSMMETRQHLEVSFSEGLEILLQSEKEDRDHRRFQRLQKSARFRYQASIEELKMDATRGMDKSLIVNLAPPKTDLLIIDDFGLTSLEQQQRLDLLEIIKDRHGRKSTIIASQLPVSSWYEIIGEETIADIASERMRRKKL